MYYTQEILVWNQVYHNSRGYQELRIPCYHHTQTKNQNLQNTRGESKTLASQLAYHPPRRRGHPSRMRYDKSNIHVENPLSYTFQDRIKIPVDVVVYKQGITPKDGQKHSSEYFTPSTCQEWWLEGWLWQIPLLWGRPHPRRRRLTDEEDLGSRAE